MKNSGKKIICGFVACAIASSIASPAFAASGYKHITNSMVKNGAVNGTESVGGGEWNYGTMPTGLTTKKCWSNYYHSEKYHSSTAQADNNIDKQYSYAGGTSLASASGDLNALTRAYWDNDAKQP